MYTRTSQHNEGIYPHKTNIDGRSLSQKTGESCEDRETSNIFGYCSAEDKFALVEHALGNSPDIAHECHEPFLNARNENFDTDTGYKQIYESIGGESFENSGESTTVVVKEMSHWIGKNEEYKKLATLTDRPIVVLVRNPLLTVESRLRRVVSSIDMRCSIDTQRFLLDDFSIEKGFRDWEELADKMKRSEYEYREELDFLKDNEGIERVSSIPTLTVQNNLLDRKAREIGYANWRDLVEKKLQEERDYGFFEGILKANTRRIAFEKNEFKTLGEEVDYFEKQKCPHIVLDTTDLRAFPEEYMQKLCAELRIEYSPEMVRWGKKPVDFHTEQKKQFEKIWYDTLYSSSGVNPPIEIPPTIGQFPLFMQEYLRSENLVVYAHLSRKKLFGNKSGKEINECEFRVGVTEGNKEYLQKIGIVGDQVEMKERVSMKLWLIDPIYALTNDPSLVDQNGFKKCADVYKEEMNIMKESLLEKREQRNDHNEKIRFR
jgi:hypothetical protein